MDIEILEGFREEANQILVELQEIVEGLESPQEDLATKKLLADFSQKIDRIMGAAKTLAMEEPDHVGFQRIGKISELCKGLGYAALNVKHPAIIPVFAAFWADTLEVVTELVKSIHDSVECNRIAGAFSAVLQKRLEWLAGRLVKLKSPTPLDIDKILKEFSI